MNYLVDMHTADSPSDKIAEQIKKRRRQLGLNREQVAELCAEAGATELTVAALTNIETGRPDAARKRRRQITAEELFTLAYVLQVHPVDLLVPDDAADDEPYVITPKVTTTAGTAREWVGGWGFLMPPASLPEVAEAVRFMPSARASEVMRRWWTPERELEQNRQINRHLDQEEQAPQDDR